MKLFDMYVNSLNAPNPNIFFRAGINAYRLGSFKKQKVISMNVIKLYKAIINGYLLDVLIGSHY